MYTLVQLTKIAKTWDNRPTLNDPKDVFELALLNNDRL